MYPVTYGFTPTNTMYNAIPSAISAVALGSISLITYEDTLALYLVVPVNGAILQYPKVK